MGWYIGGGILYLVLLITLGVVCLRNGRTWMFVVGIFIPFFWLLGAVLKPQRRY